MKNLALILWSFVALGLPVGTVVVVKDQEYRVASEAYFGRYAMVYRVTDHQNYSWALKIHKKKKLASEELFGVRELSREHFRVEQGDAFGDFLLPITAIDRLPNGVLVSLMPWAEDTFSGTLSQTELFAERIVEILVRLGQEKIVHRDLKPQNLLHYAGKLYAADFTFLASQEDALALSSKGLVAGSPKFTPIDFTNPRGPLRQDAHAVGIMLLSALAREESLEDPFKGALLSDPREPEALQRYRLDYEYELAVLHLKADENATNDRRKALLRLAEILTAPTDFARLTYDLQKETSLPLASRLGSAYQDICRQYFQ